MISHFTAGSIVFVQLCIIAVICGLIRSSPRLRQQQRQQLPWRLLQDQSDKKKKKKKKKETTLTPTAASAFQPADYSTIMDALARESTMLSLGPHGYIQGSRLREQPAIISKTDDLEKGTSAAYLVRYFGGVRYALPPSSQQGRWGLARPLPDGYMYGSQTNPANCEGKAAPCPQMNSTGGDADEDCFRCNVWVPEGEVPEGGWPVVFYIHGGFLQMGSPNDSNVARLLGETSLKCVFVAPAYRLGVLGFLSSRELMQEAADAKEASGNQGFWDQRMALEWTSKYVHFFGGNAANITVAGYSAGSYSVFHQLAHDLYLPKEKAIIRRVVMFSNGPGVVPKSAASSQEQFNELLAALQIPLNTPAAEKVAILRRTPVDKLINASLGVAHHQYRPWNDGNFISTRLFEDIDNGEFARRMLDRGVRLMNGECRDEHFLYGTWHTPAENSLAALRQRLEVDYPREACSALIDFYYPDGKLPANCTDWQDAFGRIYADAQVHMLERGFVNALARSGAAELVFRYRIEYRVKCVPLPPHWGVTHSSDVAMWFWGNGMLLEEDEKRIVSAALIEPLARFIKGEDDVQWTQQVQSEGEREQGIRQVRRLRPDGRVDVWHDEMFDRGVRVWEAVRNAQSAVAAKL